MLIISSILAVAFFVIITKIAFQVGYNKGREDGKYVTQMSISAYLRDLMKENYKR
jgi:hypothetical protein